MNTFFSFEAIRAVTIYCLLLIIFLTFLKYFLFSRDIQNHGVQKILGGLSVFTVALISGNVWIISISLFIGGLIIASEEFMEKLAIIFRSKSEHIKENLSVTIRPATEEEIKKKKQKEQEQMELQEEEEEKEDFAGEVASEQILSEIEFEEPLESKVSPSIARSIRKVAAAKSANQPEDIAQENDVFVADYLKRHTNSRYEFFPEMTVVDDSGQKIVTDGVFADKQSSTPTLVEIATINAENFPEAPEKYFPLGLIEWKKFPLTLIFIDEKVNTKTWKNIHTDIQKKYSNVDVAAFTRKGNTLEPIFIPKSLQKKLQ